MGDDSVCGDEAFAFAYAAPKTPPATPPDPMSVPTVEDENSRVFSTKNMVSSTRQLRVHSVTMHSSTASLLSPKRKKRPREFRSMLRRIRRLNLDSNDNDDMPSNHPCKSPSQNQAHSDCVAASPTSPDSNAE